MVGASVLRHPRSTMRSTMAWLNTPKAAAMTEPGTWPITEPRLQKYDSISGPATPPNSPGLGP
jgi:hypothetical protein